MVFLGLFVAAEAGVEVEVGEGVADTSVLVEVGGRTEAVTGSVGVASGVTVPAVWDVEVTGGRVDVGFCAFGVMVGTGMERLTSSVDKRSLSFPVP